MEFEIKTAAECRGLDADELEKYRDGIMAELRNADSKISVEDMKGAVSDIEAECARREDEAKLRSLKIEKVAGGAGKVLEGMEPKVSVHERDLGVDSAEYRSAWLKKIAPVDGRGVSVLGELTENEKRAYANTTTDLGAVIPTTTMDKIIETVQSSSVIYNDISKTQIGGVMQSVRHAAISSGDVAKVAEGAEVEDEKDVFYNISFTGESYSKNYSLTRKAQIQSLGSFEGWLNNHLGARMGNALDNAVLGYLEDTSAFDISTAADWTTHHGMNKANVLKAATSGTLTLADLRKAQSVIKLGPDAMPGACYVYANGNTIWNQIAAVQNGDGSQAFIASNMDSDPTIQGRINGKLIKLDDNIADNKILIGYPGLFEGNHFDPINIATDVPNIRDRNLVYNIFTIFEGFLTEPKAFAELQTVFSA